jgi:hypothetical protein
MRIQLCLNGFPGKGGELTRDLFVINFLLLFRYGSLLLIFLTNYIFVYLNQSQKGKRKKAAKGLVPGYEALNSGSNFRAHLIKSEQSSFVPGQINQSGKKSVGNRPLHCLNLTDFKCVLALTFR